MKTKQFESKNSANTKETHQLSKEIIRLLASYDRIGKLKGNEFIESKYKVSQVLGSLAFFYERIRNTLDYKGDHLLRKNAIERILKRLIWEKKTKNLQKASEELIKELIWARYLPNSSVPKEKITILSLILGKYMKLFSLFEDHLDAKELEENRNWFIGVLSSEVEEILDPTIYLKESLNYEVYSWFKGRFVWEGHKLSEKERDIQIFIAVHRSLSKSDSAWIRHRLIEAYLPEWENISGDEIEGNLDRIIEVKGEIETQLKSPYQPKMFRFVQRQLPAFLVLKDFLDKHHHDAKNILEVPKRLESAITKVCDEKYNQIGERIRKGIVRSIIYIFFTKAVLALLIEIPYEYYVAKSLNYLTLAINITFPPFLMFLIGMTIKKPTKENTYRVIQIINSFVYTDDDIEKIPFSLEGRKIGSIISRIFLTFYIFLFLLVFGSIGVLLIGIGFNVLSSALFFIFLSLVLLFVYRVRYTATELNVQGEKEGFWSHVFSLITIPFINVGSLLSQGFQRLNVFLLIMDFLIEAPLKNIISVFEEWNIFIREKREEVIEVPN